MKCKIVFLFITGIAGALTLFANAAIAQLGEWSVPVNLGPVVNSEYVDSCVSISKNGRSLFFFSSRHDLGKSGAWHLYVSKRPSVDAPWETPQEVAGFNDGRNASCPALSPDERRLYFSSARPGGCGGSDIWVSERYDPRDDFGWQAPTNLGCARDGGFNSSQNETGPNVFEDETGTEVMYFSSTRPGIGGADIWESRMRDDGTFGPAALIAELSSPAATDVVAVRRDGLEVIVASDRPGGAGSTDLWTASRESTEDPWPTPVLVPLVNSTAADAGRMSYSFNGRALYFTSDREGGFGNRDLYMITRERIRPNLDPAKPVQPYPEAHFTGSHLRSR